MRSSVVHTARFLEELYTTYNRPEFIHPDPLEFLEGYPDIADREIVGLIASSLAYGRVAQILKSISCILDQMGPSPRQFLEDVSRETLNALFSGFKHRFTTGGEVVDFLMAIKDVIKDRGSLRQCFLMHYYPDAPDITGPLESFVYEVKSHLHMKENSLLPCPEKGSACKRFHLFLRWMVRNDAVDPGGWDGISASKLIVPLDVHMHRICMRLGLTSRAQADLKTALEVTGRFRAIVPEDPVRYDFALTRIGIRNDIDPAEIMEYKHMDRRTANSMGGACNG